MDLDPSLVAAAGQCAMAPLRIALGALGFISPLVLSHEWPFGVGYMVADLMGGERP